MTDYTNTFGGAAKDSANDTILGVDFDTEFDALVTHVATKANTASPSFTGTVTSAGAVAVNSTTDSTSGTTGSIQTDGGIGAVKDIISDANIKSKGTTDSTSGTTGALQSAGGIGAVKDIASDANFVPATAGKGMDFSANTGASGMTSELFDWYEEGIFTVTLTPTTSGSITINTSNDTLAYTRVGRVCHIQGQLTVSSVSSPVGNVTVSSLPFTAATLSEDADIMRIPVFMGTLGTSPDGFKQGFISAAATTITLSDVDNTFIADDVAGNTVIAFNFSYITA